MGEDGQGRCVEGRVLARISGPDGWRAVRPGFPHYSPHTASTLLRFLLVFVSLAGLALLVVAVLLVYYQDYLILPSIGYQRKELIPGPGVRRIALAGRDGVELNVWAYKPASGEAERRAALVFHGNGDTVETSAHVARLMVELGFETFCMDYRGSGGSAGFPSENLLISDAETLWERVSGELGFAPDKVALVGVSFGTGIASHLASRHAPPLLVLVAPYRSMKHAIADHPLYWPFSRLSRYELSNERNVGSLGTTNVVAVHGTDDVVIRHDHTRALEKAYRGTGRFFAEIVHGANHWDITDRAWPFVREKIREVFPAREPSAS